jgi:hypothetical protein
MTTRRRFIEILPTAGLCALAACGDKTPPPSPAGVPAAAPAPDPVPSATVSPSAASAPSTAPSPAPAAAPMPSAAATGPMVDPSEATAVALGYVTDAKSTKNAKHTDGAACGNCALFGGKAGDSAGPCPLYNGRQVSASGWCTAYAKKA